MYFKETFAVWIVSQITFPPKKCCTIAWYLGEHSIKSIAGIAFPAPRRRSNSCCVRCVLLLVLNTERQWMVIRLVKPDFNRAFATTSSSTTNWPNNPPARTSSAPPHSSIFWNFSNSYKQPWILDASTRLFFLIKCYQFLLELELQKKKLQCLLTRSGTKCHNFVQ